VDPSSQIGGQIGGFLIKEEIAAGAPKFSSPHGATR